MYVLRLRDGSRVQCCASEVRQASAQALRLRATLEADGQEVDCLAALGLDRPGLFDVPRRNGLKIIGAEVRALVMVAGLTGGQVAQLVGGDPRKFRAWVGDELAMPWAAWHILAVYLGLSEPARIEAK